MKKLLTITALLFSVTSFGQKQKLTLSASDTAVMLHKSNSTEGYRFYDKTKTYKSTGDIRAKDFIKMHIDDGISPLVWQGAGLGIKSEQIAVIRSSGKDTLDITYPSLIKNNHLFKYIKVGDKVFKEVEEQSNFGYFGSIGFAQPLVLNNNGYYAIASPATTPIIDTVKWIAPFKRADTTSYTTPKIICRRIIDSLYYKTPKPIKNNTKKANKNKKQ